MARHVAHLLAALMVWSSLYAGLAFFRDKSTGSTRSLDQARFAGGTPRCPRSAASLKRPGNQYSYGLSACERELAATDDWFSLGRAVREEFDARRRSDGDRGAFERIGGLLAQNPNVTRATLDPPYVRVVMPNRPDYVVFVNQVGQPAS